MKGWKNIQSKISLQVEMPTHTLSKRKVRQDWQEDVGPAQRGRDLQELRGSSHPSDGEQGTGWKGRLACSWMCVEPWRRTLGPIGRLMHTQKLWI